jgi:heterodisulfide reductase subunit B
MEMAYYPGCTMKSDISNGTGFELSALESGKLLGIEFKEMDKWYCCGTVYSMTSDDLMKHVSSTRNLIQLQESGSSEVMTLCSMCYQTMEMSNHMLKEDPKKQKTLSQFMDEEAEYLGGVEIHHFLEVIFKHIGIEKLRKYIKKPLKGLRVSPYYGCAVTRPKSVGFDSMEDPHTLEELLTALGAEIVYNPFQEECCGSYHTVGKTQIVAKRTYEISMASIEEEVDLLVLTCPLCQFNLDDRQKICFGINTSDQGLPIVYFTQLLSLALGIDPKVCKFENHYISPEKVLRAKNII